jgi:hypothetical protein
MLIIDEIYRQVISGRCAGKSVMSTLKVCRGGRVSLVTAAYKKYQMWRFERGVTIQRKDT